MSIRAEPFLTKFQRRGVRRLDEVQYPRDRRQAIGGSSRSWPFLGRSAFRHPKAFGQARTDDLCGLRACAESHGSWP